MKVIGRRVTFGGWGKKGAPPKEVSITVTVDPSNPVPDGEARLFELVEIDGEVIERPLGPPAYYARGHSLNDYVVEGTVWYTPEEWVKRGGTL